MKTLRRSTLNLLKQFKAAGGVVTLNGLTGTLSITGGENVTVTTAASSITIASAAGGGGDGTDSLLRSIFVPPAPTSVTAVAQNAQAVVSWTAPTGVIAQAPITDYAVQFSSDSGSSWTTFSDGTSTATSATVTGLTNGTSYVFRVAAVNAVGQGAWSSASASVTPNTNVSIDYMVVGGGGGGGTSRGGGGGAGGYIYSSGEVTLGDGVSVTVGSGGAGGTSAATKSQSRGSSGGSSVLSLPAGAITAVGGGYGAAGLSTLQYGSSDDGGSGGTGRGGGGARCHRRWPLRVC
jgi:hypothetical protein